MNKQRKNPKLNRRGGFSLMEVLVVVGLIIVMAAMALPAILGSKKTLRVARAQRMCKLLKAGIDGYEIEYRRMPIPRGNWSDDTYEVSGGDGQYILKVLKGSNLVNGVENPNNLIFLDVPEKEEDEVEDMKDPWENDYILVIDANRNGTVQYKGEDFRASVIVISMGPDGLEDTNDDLKSSY